MNHAAHCHKYYHHMCNKYIDHFEASMFFYDKASYYWGLIQNVP